MSRELPHLRVGRERSARRARHRGSTLLRATDRYLGIPVVALGGVLRRRRPRPAAPSTIGLLNSTSIGDTVLMSAVVRDIADAFPRARLVFFAGETNRSLVHLIEGVTAVTVPFVNPLETIRAIRRERVDLIVDFDSWPRIEPVYCLLSGARYSVGFRCPGQYRHYGFDDAVDHSAELHELDNYRRLAAVLGVESRRDPRLRPPGVLSEDDLPERPYVVFHPWPSGVRSRLKEWPVESWRALGEGLAAEGYTIVVTGSIEDEPRARAFVESTSRLAGRIVSVAGRYDLGALADLLHASRCVISVNTGVAHLAAAVGSSTVALNGPTSDKRWGPIGERAVSVNSSGEGCGYLYLGWEYDGHRTDCMDGISVARVMAAAREVMVSESTATAAHL